MNKVPVLFILYHKDHLETSFEICPKLNIIIMLNCFITNRKLELKDISISRKNVYFPSFFQHKIWFYYLFKIKLKLRFKLQLVETIIISYFRFWTISRLNCKILTISFYILLVQLLWLQCKLIMHQIKEQQVQCSNGTPVLRLTSQISQK